MNRFQGWLRRGVTLFARALLRLATEPPAVSGAHAPPPIDGEPPAEWIALVQDKAPQLLESLPASEPVEQASSNTRVSAPPAVGPNTDDARGPYLRARDLDEAAAPNQAGDDFASAVSTPSATRSPVRLSVRRPIRRSDSPRQHEDSAEVADRNLSLKTEPAERDDRETGEDPASDIGRSRRGVLRSRATSWWRPRHGPQPRPSTDPDAPLGRITNRRSSWPALVAQTQRSVSGAVARIADDPSPMGSALTLRRRSNDSESTPQPALAEISRAKSPLPESSSTKNISQRRSEEFLGSTRQKAAPDHGVVTSARERPSPRPSLLSAQTAPATTAAVDVIAQHDSAVAASAPRESTAPWWTPLPSRARTVSIQTSFTERRRREHEAI